MKICIIQGAFLPVPALLGGAVEKMWFRLGQEFSNLGHQVVHISRLYGDLPDRETLDGVIHKRVQGFTQPKNLLVLKVYDFLYSRRACRAVPVDADIVITNTFWAPLLLSRRLRKRAYVDIQRMPKGQSKFYSQAARLRANSTPVAEAIRDELPVTKHLQVTLVPNPLPFDPVEDLDLTQKENRVLYCGRVHPEKGLDLLMLAAQKLPESWSLEIVGPWRVSQGGEGETYLENLKRLAGNARVTFHGPIFNSDKLADHYRQAAIFVYPSIAEKGETFGLAPLEAMAWQCVPIVSDLSCFKDFVRDQCNGLIFNHRAENAADLLSDTIRKLIEDPALRIQLAMSTRTVNVTHSPREIASQFLTSFERAVAALT